MCSHDRVIKMSFIDVVKLLKNADSGEYLFESKNARLVFSNMEIDYNTHTLVLYSENGNFIRTPKLDNAVIQNRAIHTSINITTNDMELISIQYIKQNKTA